MVTLLCIDNRVSPDLELKKYHGADTAFTQLIVGKQYDLEEHSKTQYKVIGPAYAAGSIFDKTYFAETMPTEKSPTKIVAGETMPTEKSPTKIVAGETIVDTDDLPF